jgi:hypothetical protein
MGQAAHATDIAYSNAFSIDKICGIKSNTFTADAWNVGGYLYQYTIPHNLTRPAFCDALFSTSNSTYIPNGQADAVNSYNCYSDANNFYLLTTADSGLIYYKLVSTWIDNFDATNPLIDPVFNTTLVTSNSTYFDSRANYQKVYKQNVVTLTNPGAGNTGTYTIPHPLGYVPNYKIFFESLPGQVWPSISGGASDIWLYNVANQYECYGVMTNAGLTLTYNGGSASAANFRVWWRIYYDQ